MDNHKGPARFDRSEPAGDTGQEVSVWRFAPLADYRPPSPPVSSAAGRTWSSLTRLFGGSGDKAQSPAVDRDQLITLAPEQLKRLSPAPDWAAAAQVLDRALGDWWRQDRPERPVHHLRLAAVRRTDEKAHWLLRVVLPPPVAQGVVEHLRGGGPVR